MYWVWQTLGCLIVAAAMYDVFHVIFHPTESGTLSDMLARGVWNCYRTLARWHPQTLTYAGPVAVVLIISMWIGMVILGCALIYYPHMDVGFAYISPADAGKHHTFFDAVNLSLDSLSTITGEMSPRNRTLRLAMGLETLTGFAILSASISWLLSIYPVLERRRSLGQIVRLMQEAEEKTGTCILNLQGSDSERVVLDLRDQLVTLRNDTIHFPITYYFHEADDRAGFEILFPYLQRFATSACEPHQPPALRAAGMMLRTAIEDFMSLVADYVGIDTQSTSETIHTLAKEHLREPD